MEEIHEVETIDHLNSRSQQSRTEHECAPLLSRPVDSAALLSAEQAAQTYSHYLHLIAAENNNNESSHLSRTRYLSRALRKVPKYTFLHEKFSLLEGETIVPKGEDYSSLQDEESMFLEVARYVENKIMEDFGFIPIPLSDSSPSTTVLASPDWKTASKLLLLIQNASGAQIGIYSRTLCVEKGISQGSWLEYIRQAIILGFSVILLRPNANSIREYENGETRKVLLHGSESPEQHVLTVWEKLICNNEFVSCIVLIGYGNAAALCKDLLTKEIAIASSIRHLRITKVLTIEAGQILEEDDSEDIRTAVKNIFLNFERNVTEKGKRLPSSRESQIGCSCISLGNNDDKTVAGSVSAAIQMVFQEVLSIQQEITPLPTLAERTDSKADISWRSSIRSLARKSVRIRSSTSSVGMGNESNDPFSFGVKLFAIIEELELIKQNKTTLVNWDEATTTEICEKIIKPQTEKEQCSYLDYLRATQPSFVGSPTVFISHAWKYKFCEVIHALKRYFAKEPEVVVWFDLFCNNQHKAPSYPFSWWCNTFRSAIAKIGRTVMVLTPWNDPIPLQRGWCVWELYCTYDERCDFDIVMTSDTEFIDDVEKNPTLVFEKMLATIDTERSQCFKTEDQLKIHEAIKESVGFLQLNQKIFDVMRGWITKRYTIELNASAHSLGRTHKKVLESMQVLAVLYKIQGKFDEAQLLLEESFALIKPAWQENPILAVVCLGNLAGIYLDQGNYRKALPLSDEVYQITKALMGIDHPATLKAMANLALVYKSLGDYEKAEALNQECLERRKIVLGDSHLDTLTSLMNIATIYQDKFEYERAFRSFSDCYERYKVHYGENHPNTLNCMKSISNVLLLLEEYGTALPLSQQCYLKTISVFGEDHPDAFSTLLSLADVNAGLGDIKTACSIFEHCYAKLKDSLGKNHPFALKSLDGLVFCYKELGDFERAIRLGEDCVQRRKASDGPTHQCTLVSIGILAELYLNQGHVEKAEPLLVTYCENIDAVSRINDKHAIKYLSNLATIYNSKGEYVQALPLYELVYKRSHLAFGANHPNTIISLNNLARMYQNNKDYDKALYFYEECLEKTKVISGEYDPNTLRLLNNVALVCGYCDQWDKAQSLLEECFQKSKLGLGEFARPTLTYMNNLITVYSKRGDINKAFRLSGDYYDKCVAVFGETHEETTAAMANYANLLKNFMQSSKA